MWKEQYDWRWTTPSMCKCIVNPQVEILCKEDGGSWHCDGGSSNELFSTDN